MRNVIFLAYNIYGIGGTVRHVVNTANYLHEHGCHVTILSVNRILDNPRLPLHRGIRIVPLQESRKGKKKPWLQRLLKRQPSVLIHKDEDLYEQFSLYTDIKLLNFLVRQRRSTVICTLPSFFFLARFLRWRGCSVIMQEHKGYAFHSPALQEKLCRTVPRAKVIHCVNFQDQEKYLSLFPRADVRWISNTVSLPAYSCTHGSKIIISAGHLASPKNFPLLLRAFACCKASSQGWQLHIYGNGKDAPMLHDLALQWGLSGRLCFIPSVDNLMQRYAKAGFYVSSSLRESFGLTMLEAMACGLPVVATVTDGSSLLVEENVTGILVPQNDHQLLAAALDRLAENEELRIRMGQAGRAKAASFTMEALGQSWLEMLQ